MANYLHKLFSTAEATDASDIHLTKDEPAYLRIGGRIVPAKDRPLTEDDIIQMIEETFLHDERQRFEQRGYIDYAYETTISHDGRDKLVRYRMHLYRSRGSMTAAMRRIKLDIPSFEQLMLPPAYEKVMSLRPKGIIVIGGETGSGKSTTLACMIDYINSRREKHIVTIEDPIEYVIGNGKSKINQRELGQDFSTFPDALRAVVREDPDVIMIGELRDSETVRAAIAAAETGHLVLTSLHIASAAEAVHRILYFFPPHEENSVRQNLSGTLIAVLNQILLPTAPEAVRRGMPKRIPATEVLLNNSVVREYLRDPDHDRNLMDLISEQGGDLSGMHDFNFSLKQLCEKELLGTDVAIGASLRPEHLRMAFKGIAV